MSDYTIMLDMTKCNDLDLVSNRLSCKPPPSDGDIERSASEEKTIPVTVVTELSCFMNEKLSGAIIRASRCLLAI